MHDAILVLAAISPRNLLRALERGGRRLWRSPRRLHVEAAAIPAEGQVSLARAVREVLPAIPGVRWARFNAHLNRVIVEVAEGTDERAVLRRIAALERSVAGKTRKLVSDAEPLPGDDAAEHGALIEIAADVVGLSIGLALRVVGARPLPFDLDVASVLSLLDNLPRLRAPLEHRYGRATVEVALAVLTAIDQGLLQGLGPVVHLVLAGLRLREHREARATWNLREPELFSEPDRQREVRATVPPRPAAVAPGPAERYARTAVPAAVTGFALGLVRARSVERAAGLIFGAVPKPVRYGRDAFLAHVGWRLARRRVLVLSRAALRRLDRIDTLVVSAAALEDGRDPVIARLWREAQGAGLELLVSGDRGLAGRMGARALPSEGGLVPGLQRLQASGRTVAYVGVGPEEAFVAADLAIHLGPGRSRLQESGSPRRAGTADAPWGAHVVCRAGFDDVRVLIAAMVASRGAARQSVIVGVAQVAAALSLLAAGLHRRTTRRVMTVANVASLAAMVNAMRLAHAATAAPAPAPRRAPPWHSFPVEQVLEQLGTTLDGLSPRTVAARTAPPKPSEPPARALARLTAEELNNPLTPILAGGAGISAFTGSPVDSALIGCVIALNGLIGGVQRFRVEDALRALRQDQRQTTRVRRGGVVSRIDSAALVPGDVVLLEAGEVVPADVRVVRAEGLELDESSLTGESLPVAKAPAPVGSVPVAERSSMLYAGTSLAAGSAEAIVVATGDATEARRALQEGAQGERRSGVEKRLERLTRLTIPVAGFSGAAVAASGLLREGGALEVMNAGVALALSAVPEGLPLLATLSQLAAAKRLSRRGVLTRNARALEALGRVNVLCSDKTGTLTEGHLELGEVSDGAVGQPLERLDGSHQTVVAAALRASPVAQGGPKVPRLRWAADPRPRGTWTPPAARERGARERGARERGARERGARERGAQVRVGRRGALPHPTDQALIDGAARARVRADLGAPGFRRFAELPFEPGRGYHATLGLIEGTGSGATTGLEVFPAATGAAGDASPPAAVLSVKGAPEIVLQRCTAQRTPGGEEIALTEGAEARLRGEAMRIAARGLRVLAVAERRGGLAAALSDGDVQGLTFLGFVAFADPVRSTAPAAVDRLAAAGIQVVMLTGDHPATAEAIARQVGLKNGKTVMTGPELDALDDARLAARIFDVAVFARVTPEQKVRIVKAFQGRGRVVAMTGDGANDAPAIRLANVGIALGAHGPEAARKAADLVVASARIETIVDAVLEGRALWGSVREAVSLLVGGNLGEIGFVLFGSLLEGRSPLNPRQLLLLNLLTDALPAAAIALRPLPHRTAKDLLEEGPEQSLGRSLNRQILWRGVLTASAAGVAWLWALVTGGRASAKTVALLALTGAQLGQTVAVAHRSQLAAVSSLGSMAALLAVAETPALSRFFGCRPVGPLGLVQAGLAAAGASMISAALPKLRGLE